jgi:WD40 repeat protein
VAWSPDGGRLASASGDWTAILWDVDSRRPLASLEGHKSDVTGVAFGPDGQRLASASRDGTLVLWDVYGRKRPTMTETPGALVAEACRTANRNLTCTEWRDYIGVNRPYHRTCESLPARCG